MGGPVINTANATRRSVFLAVIFLFCAGLATGQIAGGLTETTNAGLGGNNFVVGTVFSPAGSPINTRIRIRLTTPTSGEILATTDDSGRFVFSNVGSGLYTLVIDEKEFEPVRQEVEITHRRSNVPETYTMTIQLRAAHDKSKAAKPSVIDISNAGVPKRAMEFYEKASKLAEARDYRGAIEQLKLAVARYPEFVNALNQMGVLYLQLNEPNLADEALRAALKIKPDAFGPLINRGVTLFRLARYPEAEVVLRNALKAQAESAVAYYYLGRTLNKMGRNNEAEAAYLRCIKLSPGEFKEAHRLLAAIYLERGALNRVIEELEIYLKLVPKAPDASDLRRVIEQSKRSMGSAQPEKRP
jgi:tetratricopeptide (TPR) repeat protein